MSLAKELTSYMDECPPSGLFLHDLPIRIDHTMPPGQVGFSGRSWVVASAGETVATLLDAADIVIGTGGMYPAWVGPRRVFKVPEGWAQ